MTKFSRPKSCNINTLDPANPDFAHRESHDSYKGKIIDCRDIWRVIICRDGMQFIVQKRSSGTNTGVWKGKSHCATREELINVCARLELLSEANVEATLRALPLYARDYCVSKESKSNG